MKKFLIFEIGKEEFAIELINILHIFNILELNKDIDEKQVYVVGNVSLKNDLFFVVDLRDKITGDFINDHSNKVLITECKYKDILHYKEKDLTLPIGFIVDKVVRRLDVEEKDIGTSTKMVGEVQLIRINESVIPIFDFSKYLFDDMVRVIISLTKKRERELKEIEGRKSIYSQQTDSEKRERIKELWKKTHGGNEEENQANIKTNDNIKTDARIELEKEIK